MTVPLRYQEKLSSNKTTGFFILLTGIFTALFLWRLQLGPFDWLATLFIIIAIFFLFYVINYRTLSIQLTASTLSLSFGLFTWQVPLDNIVGCRLDSLPPLLWYGGAGIHFMNVAHRPIHQVRPPN